LLVGATTIQKSWKRPAPAAQGRERTHALKRCFLEQRGFCEWPSRPNRNRRYATANPVRSRHRALKDPTTSSSSPATRAIAQPFATAKPGLTSTRHLRGCSPDSIRKFNKPLFLKCLLSRANGVFPFFAKVLSIDHAVN
jgi:hypothetical protein